MSSEAEVIQEWADADSGWSFERGRMQKAVRALCFDTPAVLPSRLAPSNFKGKKEDVTFLVEELMLTRTQAEAALAAAAGDVTKAIQAVVVPPTKHP